MADNLAYDMREDEPWEELIDGRVVAMSPRPSINHHIISLNIYNIFKRFLRGKPCRPFGDGVDLYLTEEDRFVPDGMVVCDKSKIRSDGIHGGPDLVIEVLSPSTSRQDKIYKKDVYERCGVREYWIVSPQERMVEQYVLEDGKFVLRDVYQQYPDYRLERMTEAEKAALVTEFRCTLFPDLAIRLDDIFEDLLPG